MEETIQTLGERMDRRFEAMDRRFEQIDKRFEEVDRRFEQIDQRFEEVDRRFERIDQRFEEVDRRFEQIDQRFDRVDGRIDRLRDEMLIGFEKVQDRLKIVLERFDDFIEKDKINIDEHKRIDQTLEAQDLRILALESGSAPKPQKADGSQPRSGPALLSRKKRQK